MRSLIISGAITLFLLLSSIGSYKYIERSSGELVARIDTVEKLIYARNWEVAKKELDDTEQNWEKTKDWWSVLINHEEVDKIDISLKRLEKYVETEGLSLSLGELSALKLLFGHIADTEAFTFKNIF